MDEDRWENIILGEITVLSRLNHPHAAPPPFVASFPITKLTADITDVCRPPLLPPQHHGSSMGWAGRGHTWSTSPSPMLLCRALPRPNKPPNPGEFHEAAPTTGFPSSSHGSRRTTSVHSGTSLCSEQRMREERMRLSVEPDGLVVKARGGRGCRRQARPSVTFLHCEAGCKPESLGNWRKGALEPGREETGFYLWVTSSTQAQATATESCCLLAPCRLAVSPGLPTSPAGRPGFTNLHPAPPERPLQTQGDGPSCWASPLPEPGNPQTQPCPTST